MERSFYITRLASTWYVRMASNCSKCGEPFLTSDLVLVYNGVERHMIECPHERAARLKWWSELSQEWERGNQTGKKTAQDALPSRA